MSNLLGMALIEEFVSTVILTGRLRGCEPLSVVLIATPECGKTSVVLERPCKAILALTDVTGRGLMELCKLRGEITHFILNDLVTVMSHKAQVNQYTLSVLNAMTEEGIQTVAFPGSIEHYESGKRGIIACTTYDVFKDGRAWWHKSGLSSRLLPFAFDHPHPLQIRIKKLIKDNRVNGTKLVKDKPKPHRELIVPDAHIRVTLSSKHADTIGMIAETKATLLGDPKGYRRLKQYLTLTQAHALYRTWKQPSVNDEDIEFLRRVNDYISYSEMKSL